MGTNVETKQDLINLVQQNLQPQEAFTPVQLQAWADAHQSAHAVLPWLTWGLYGLTALVALIFLLGLFFTVAQQHRGVVERFGKFARLAGPGLNLKWPLIESLVDEVSLRVEELVIGIKTKTLDNVFVEMQIAIQRQVLAERVFDAYYQLEDVDEQMRSYVYDTAYAQVPKLKLDEVFERKDDIAQAVGHHLNDVMAGYGYKILATLVVSVTPDEKVQVAMNEINAAVRHRAAASEVGEANRLLTVANAQAESEAKKLQGEGIAAERAAILNGLRDSIKALEGVPGVDAHEAMNLILLTNYFDMLKAVGAKGTTLMLPHGPGAFAEMQSTLAALIVAKGNKS